VLLLLSLSLSVNEIGEVELGVIRRRRLTGGSLTGSFTRFSLVGDDLFNNSILVLFSSPLVVSFSSIVSPFVLSVLDVDLSRDLVDGSSSFDISGTGL
jgi:hypothetical protein